MRRWIITSCLLILHTPDGGSIYVEGSHIVAVRPVAEASKDHLSEGTSTVIYTLDKNFGVSEKAEDIVQQIERCEQQ